MSAIGPKRTLPLHCRMSAFGGKAGKDGKDGKTNQRALLVIGKVRQRLADLDYPDKRIHNPCVGGSNPSSAAPQTNAIAVLNQKKRFPTQHFYVALFCLLFLFVSGYLLVFTKISGSSTRHRCDIKSGRLRRIRSRSNSAAAPPSNAFRLLVGGVAGAKAFENSMTTRH